nr:response regulator [Enterovirga sp. DB1703]
MHAILLDFAGSRRPEAMASQDRKPVFVVDDDPGALNSLRFLLESEGYDVFTFRDGEELLSSLPRPEPTCLIIDFKLPAMDGMDLFRRLRERNVLAPVILVTGHPDPAIRRRADKAGLDLIEKPLSQDVLLSAVEAARAGRFRRPELSA